MCHFCFEGSLSKNILTGKAVVIVVIGHSLWLVTLPLQKFMLWQFITISGGFRTPWYLNIWPLLCCSKVCHTETVNDSHWKHRWCLLGLFLCFPSTHSPSLLIWLWYFSSVPAKEPNNTFPVPVLTGFGTVRAVYGPERNCYSELHWIYERKLQDKSRQNSILSPSENPLSNARDTWVSHNKIVNLICFNCILLNYNV